MNGWKENADITNTHGFVVGINRHSNRHTSEEVQVAFKVLMTHWILQFALRIAFRCVLHRCGSQDIHCWKCWIVILFYENSESNIVLVCFFIPKECQVLFLQKKKEILFVFCVHGTCLYSARRISQNKDIQCLSGFLPVKEKRPERTPNEKMW